MKLSEYQIRQLVNSNMNTQHILLLKIWEETHENEYPVKAEILHFKIGDEVISLTLGKLKELAALETLYYIHKNKIKLL